MRYSKKARTKRFILKLLLTLLILAAVGSLALIITGYIVGDEQSSSSQTLSSDIVSENESVSNSSEETSSLTSSETSSETEPESEPVSSEAEPEPEEEVIEVAVKMPLETLLNPTERAAFLNKAAQNGAHAVIFDAKNTKGKVYYRSELQLAAACGAIDENAIDLTEVVAEINAAGLKAAAYLSALQDPIAAHTDYGTSYRYGNTQYTWLDNAANKGGKAWLNPYLENTQEYLTGMVKELSDAGCDMIFVDKMRYPTAYTSKLNQGNSTVSRQDMLSELAQKMDAAARCDVIFCFEAESYFGKNTAQYNGTPSGIQGLTKIAPRITLSDFSGISSDFSEVSLSEVNPDNLKLILDEISTQCSNAVLTPCFAADTLSEEILAVLAQYGVTTVWTE